MDCLRRVPTTRCRTTRLVGLVSAVAGLLLGAQLRAIGLLYVSGMVAHVTSAAAVGRTLTHR